MSLIQLSFIGPTGISCSGTIQRVSDGYYRQAYAENFVNGLAFASKAFPLTEGSLENKGNYQQQVTGNTWPDGLYNFRVHNTSITDNPCIGGCIFAIKGGAEVSLGYENDVLNVYHADIQLIRDNKNAIDEYTVTWFVNGIRLTSGITSPTIHVVNRSTAIDLIATNTVLTQIGTTGSYKYDASGSQRQTLGETYLIIASATINGAVRTFSWNLGRDV